MKYTTPKELLDTGILFEINRRVLHPLGLALAVSVDEEGTVTFSNEVWDNREDPEGIAFAPKTFLEGEKKWSGYIEEKGLKARVSRLNRLGYITQTKEEMIRRGELKP